MTARVKTLTTYLVAAVYLVILVSLLRPGGAGSAGVVSIGSALADIAAG